MNRKASTELLLRSLCLSTIASQYKDLAKNAENDNWDHIHYLHNLCEVELVERARRRVQRRLKQSKLPEGKTMDTLDQRKLPLKVRRQIPRLLDGDFVKRAENVLAFGLPAGERPIF